MAGIDEYTVLLLQSETTHGSTTFTDTGGGTNCPHTISVYGNTEHSTDQAKFGSSSIHFDGTGDYLTVPDSVDWDFGTGDFTIDFWFNFAALKNQNSFMDGRATLSISPWTLNYFGPSGVFPNQFSWYDGIDHRLTFGNPAISTGSWHHLALVRSSGTLRLYVDGTYYLSRADSVNYTKSGGVLTIGKALDANVEINGYMEEIRISKGIARWTENFTPPTGPYSLISTSFTDIPLNIDILQASTAFTDVPLDIYIVVGASLTDILLDINIQRQYFTNIPLDIYIAGKSYKNIPLDVLIDIALYMGDVPLNIHIMDGKFFVDIPLNLSIVKTIPSFKSIVLQRIASILHDIT